MASEQGSKIKEIEKKEVESTLAEVLDASLSSVGTSISSLTSEYKHLDELYKLMLSKLKDIRERLLQEGNEWYDKRTAILNDLTPFLTEIETVKENSEILLRMVKKIDLYTQSLETRVNEIE